MRRNTSVPWSAGGMSRPRRRGCPGFSTAGRPAGGQDDGMRNTAMLKENRDFRRIYKKGRACVGREVVVYCLKNRSPRNRIGITTGKKLGNAVERNRAKRIIRESYRLLEGRTQTGWDFVFVARSRALRIKMDEMKRTMANLFEKAGVLRR